MVLSTSSSKCGMQWGHFAVAKLVHQHKSAVYKIAKNAYQFVVVSILKTFPGKLAVFGFGR